MDGRRSEALFWREQRADLIAHLGGEPTAPQLYYIEEAAFLRLQLSYFRAFLAEHPPINRKKRTATPLLRDYLAMVAALQKLLGDLGLERKARDLGTYCTRCQRTYGADYLSHACAVSPPATPPLDASAAGSPSTTAGGPTSDPEESDR